MLNKTFSDELVTLYMIYERSNYQDILIPEVGLMRYNFGLPYIEERTMTQKGAMIFLHECAPSFIEESVFDDKYLAYKAWAEESRKKQQEIKDFLESGEEK